MLRNGRSMLGSTRNHGLGSGYGGGNMARMGIRSFGIVFGIALFMTASLALSAWQLSAQTQTTDGVLEGVVTSPNGPEAGVWVIAETADLPTKYTKIVVTDDQGRYVLP